MPCLYTLVMSRPTPSAEQKAVLDDFAAGHNIRIDAVAGAGKSTCLLMCAEQAQKRNRSWLILTYNKPLQLELEERAKQWGLQVGRRQVLTYHSAAGVAYGNTIQDDEQLLCALEGEQPWEDLLQADVVMLDEVQDMTPHFFKFVQYHLLLPNTQIVLVGDERQCINDYMGSSAEFLTRCPELFTLPDRSQRPWQRLTLTTSYRLTPANAEFVNTHLRGPTRLIGGNAAPGPLPKYVSVYGVPFVVAQHILKELTKALTPPTPYSHGDIAVVCPSVKMGRQSPMSLLVEMIDGTIPILRRDCNEAQPRDPTLAKAIAKNKVLFATNNSMKGCDRPLIFLVGFDETYFEYYARNWHRADAVPNVLYVAATRARTELIIVASHDKTLRTIDMDRLYDTCRVDAQEDPWPPHAYPAKPKQSDTTWAVLDLLSRLDPTMLGEANKCVQEISRATRGGSINMPAYTATFARTVEMVGHFYGRVIPAKAEWHRLKSRLSRPFPTPVVVAHPPGFGQMTKQTMGCYKERYWKDMKELKGKRAVWTDEEWIRVAVAEESLSQCAPHVANQILDYNWVPDGVAFTRAGVEFLNEVLHDKPGRFEVLLCYGRVRGIADFVDDTGHVYEFKVTHTIESMHILQLACYVALAVCMGKQIVAEGTLVHIPTRTLVSVRVDDPKRFLEMLVEAKDIVPNENRDLDAELTRAGASNGCRPSMPDVLPVQCLATQVSKKRKTGEITPRPHVPNRRSGAVGVLHMQPGRPGTSTAANKQQAIS